MKHTLQIILHLVFTFLLFVNSFAITISREAHYIPIDSLSSDHASRYVALDFKTKKTNILIGDQLVTFTQACHINTAPYRQQFRRQFLTGELEDKKILFSIIKLLSVDNDYIYISATYQQYRYNRGGERIGQCTILEFFQNHKAK